MTLRSALPAALFDDFPVAEAEISDDGQYRYVLNYRWAWDGPVMTWICLNPSIANHERTDPSARRMIRFARREGCRGICILNQYGLISTDPAALRAHPNPVGPDNDRWLTLDPAEIDGPVVAAWGAHPFAARRVAEVCRLLAGVPLVCLGTTAGGHPKHPLARGRHRVPDDAPLLPWPPAAAEDPTPI